MSSISPSITDVPPSVAALLPVLRHHLAALQGSNPLGWRLAFGLAEQRWGEGKGLALAHRSQVFLSALLAARPVPLDCVDPLHIDDRDTLTEDEGNLMIALSAMSSDDAPRARLTIMALTGGRVPASAVSTGLSLVHLLGSSPTTIRRSGAPALRAVS
ncbi:hypothetical protein [Octadecabacter ascidiaceicola]|uniref:Uncharacterized protein n=1 Tax=Octadecabacter ascidiaceicola TaxID=1655543 RepID=A0A238JJN6_9RHOB|nr:hypothetical protein [Octadecabacter ascidiaceicola]SMX30869.1 hypothetical protein OCA8868_00073 [Octadecabacter ascidiaceicola]